MANNDSLQEAGRLMTPLLDIIGDARIYRNLKGVAFEFNSRCNCRHSKEKVIVYLKIIVLPMF